MFGWGKKRERERAIGGEKNRKYVVSPHVDRNEPSFHLDGRTKEKSGNVLEAHISNIDIDCEGLAFEHAVGI